MRDAHAHRRSAQGNLLAHSGGVRTQLRQIHWVSCFNGNTMPKFGLAPQGFASRVLYGAPVNMDRNGNPDVLQQPVLVLRLRVLLRSLTLRRRP